MSAAERETADVLWAVEIEGERVDVSKMRIPLLILRSFRAISADRRSSISTYRFSRPSHRSK